MHWETSSSAGYRANWTKFPLTLDEPYVSLVTVAHGFGIILNTQNADGGWVFPTALGLAALQALGYNRQTRVQGGIQFLLDRAFRSGGWNVGNPYVGSVPLPPNIINPSPTQTALGGFRISGDIVTRGRAFQPATS